MVKMVKQDNIININPAKTKRKSHRKKSAEEMANTYKAISEIFFNKVKISKIRKIIDSGKYSGKDVLAYKVLVDKDKETLNNIMKKLIPDSISSEMNIKSEFSGIRLDK